MAELLKVARIEDEITIKRFRRRGSKILLLPEKSAPVVKPASRASASRSAALNWSSLSRGAGFWRSGRRGS